MMHRLFEKIAERHGDAFADTIKEHERYIDDMVKLYTPEQLIEIGTLLVVAGTESLRQKRGH